MLTDIVDPDVTQTMIVNQLKAVELMEHVHVPKDISRRHLDVKTLTSVKEPMFVQLPCGVKTNLEATHVNVHLELLVMQSVVAHHQMNVETTCNVPTIWPAQLTH